MERDGKVQSLVDDIMNGGKNNEPITKELVKFRNISKATLLKIKMLVSDIEKNRSRVKDGQDDTKIIIRSTIPQTCRRNRRIKYRSFGECS